MTIDEWKKIDKWETTSSKTSVLFPALKEIMKDISGKKVLDVGCGEGFGVRWSKEQGAECVGVDISDINIAKCKEKDPQGKYLLMDVRDWSITEQFDYVLSILVLLSFENKQDITTAIKNMRTCLNDEGKLIIATVHPAFDIVNENMETMVRKPLDEYSYAKSGLKIEYKNKTGFSLTDFHWRIEDYSDCIRDAGLVIERIVEPLPIPESEEYGKELYLARKKYPPYIVFVCKSNI